MNFSQALEAMKAGKPVMRKISESRTTFPIFINAGEMYFYTEENGESILHQIDNLRVEDVLADDWEVVE